MNVVRAVSREAIPSIDEPSFGTAFAGADEDQVIVIEGEPARAYPVCILRYHEVVNDVIELGRRRRHPAGGGDDGLPLAVTWCPLCGCAVAYERVVAGRELTFGVSGKLADDDLVMSDRETGSEWKQSSGVCFSGELEGMTLTARPAPLFSYAAFRERFPTGVVLQPPGGTSESGAAGGDPAAIAYDRDPYETYRDGDGFGLEAHRGSGTRTWDHDALEPKERVLGLVIGEDALGIPQSRVDGTVTATVGGLDVVVFATPEGLFAYRDPGIEFSAAGSAGTFRGDGTRWDGTTGHGADGRRLERLPGRRLFAFAWVDDHGVDTLHDSQSSGLDTSPG